jgi:hypothetical protein
LPPPAAHSRSGQARRPRRPPTPKNSRLTKRPAQRFPNGAIELDRIAARARSSQSVAASCYLTLSGYDRPTNSSRTPKGERWRLCGGPCGMREKGVSIRGTNCTVQILSRICTEPATAEETAHNAELAKNTSASHGSVLPQHRSCLHPYFRTGPARLPRPSSRLRFEARRPQSGRRRHDRRAGPSA